MENILQLILDIQDVRFHHKSFKGYNVTDVDDFLDEIINILKNNMNYIHELVKIEYMINKRSFRKSINGYDPKEVDEFLESVKNRIKNIY